MESTMPKRQELGDGDGLYGTFLIILFIVIQVIDFMIKMYIVLTQNYSVHYLVVENSIEMALPYMVDKCTRYQKTEKKKYHFSYGNQNFGEN